MRWPGAARQKGSIVGLQETGIASTNWCGEISAAILPTGWKVLMALAVATQKGGISAGVALCVPIGVGVPMAPNQRHWEVSPPGCGGRLVMCILETKGLGRLLVFSVYLFTGLGLDSLGSIALLNAMVRWKGVVGLPFVATGDWQHLPSALLASPWALGLDAVPVATGQGICKCAKTGKGGKSTSSW